MRRSAPSASARGASWGIIASVAKNPATGSTGTLAIEPGVRKGLDRVGSRRRRMITAALTARKTTYTAKSVTLAMNVRSPMTAKPTAPTSATRIARLGAPVLADTDASRLGNAA